jgi:hypothetical protein
MTRKTEKGVQAARKTRGVQAEGKQVSIPLSSMNTCPFLLTKT